TLRSICTVLPSCHSTLSFTPPATTQLYTLSLHDALPISSPCFPMILMSLRLPPSTCTTLPPMVSKTLVLTLNSHLMSSGSIRKRSEEHTSELQSRENLVCRLLLEKKKQKRERSLYTSIEQ